MNKGYDIEIYKCSFDSSSIDMIIIRDMNYCLFDSSSPHDYDPSNKNDYTINLFDLASTKENTGINEAKINELKIKFDKVFESALTELSKLQELAGSIENSEIKLTHTDVEKILADYKINYWKDCNYSEYIVKLDNSSKSIIKNSFIQN